MNLRHLLIVFLSFFGVLSWAADSKVVPELYKEYPQANEKEEFEAFGKVINTGVQEKMASQTGHMARAFHSKQHGCLKGTFNVLPNLREDLQVGVLQNPPVNGYPVWVRLSNAFIKPQPDKKADARGIAIKLTEVPGEKILENEKYELTQDFLLTNKPRGTTSDAKTFMEFATDSANNQMAKFALHHPETAILLAEAALGHHVSSMLTETYWSGTPYQFGPRAVKYKVQPCINIKKKMPKHPDYDFLKEDLIATLQKEDVCFDFLVQLQTDPVAMPIEDALKRWDEKTSPFIPVAKIILPKQKFDSPAQNQFCENLNYNPWHSLPEHRPLGNMNRARRYVYDASQKLRHGGAIQEPTGHEEF